MENFDARLNRNLFLTLDLMLIISTAKRCVFEDNYYVITGAKITEI